MGLTNSVTDFNVSQNVTEKIKKAPPKRG